MEKMTKPVSKEELQAFINLANAQRALYKGCPEDIGLDLDKVVQSGISMETIAWLSHNHYIAVHKDKPIWIAYDYNKYHSRSTLANLQYFLNKNKK